MQLPTQGPAYGLCWRCESARLTVMIEVHNAIVADGAVRCPANVYVYLC